MNSYGIEITIEKIVCRDTESIHSSDRIALAGIVLTPGEKPHTFNMSEFIFPTFRINSGESFPLYKTVFNDTGSKNKVGIGLCAWDIDDNDSWVDNKGDIIIASKLIAKGVKLIPKVGKVIGKVLEEATNTIPPVIDQFVSWDSNDPLLRFSKWFDLTVEGTYNHQYQTLPLIHFRRDDPLDYSGFDYTLQIGADCSYAPLFSPFGNPYVSPEKLAMEAFKHRAHKAMELAYEAGFPNFQEATYGQSHVGGTIFLNNEAAKWQDINLLDLGNPDLKNFRARMQATHSYAEQNGFVGGFPTFYHKRKPTPFLDNDGKPIFQTVCGTVLLRKNYAEWRDVPLSELGNPNLNDIARRFRRTHDYAVKHGFIGGFPNFMHADYGNGTVCGTILLKETAGKFRDVLLYKVP